jgi:hypothetical protein
MRSAPPQYAFTSGEISPLLYGRPDYQRTQTGLRDCRGFVPLRQGLITRAPGSIHRGKTLGNLTCRRIPFVFAANDAVELEFTHLKMRVWRYGALVVSGIIPFELTTPYDAAAILRLDWVQSADVILMVDGVLPIQRLARTALDAWTIGAAEIKNGPFQPQNLDTAKTIQASAATGNITLSGSGNIFVAGHIGGLFLLKPYDDDIAAWIGNETVTINDKRRNSDGRVYRAVTGGNSGVNEPFHIEGSVLSGEGKVKWEYESDDLGIVLITAVGGANSASATVIRRLPPGVVTNPSYRWSEGAWSTKNGYPSSLAIFDQRMAAAATPTSPRNVWFSTFGTLQEFTPGDLPDDAFAYTIDGTRGQNRILWLAAGSRALHIGALGEEYSSRSTTDGEAIGPLNATFRMDSKVGSADTKPVIPDGKPIFIARDFARIFELSYSFDEDRNIPRELSLAAEHLGAEQFLQLEWQNSPQRIGWIRTGAGNVVLFIHDPQEDVLGWARLPVAGGFVEEICISPDASGKRDIVTLVVRRVVDGATERHVEEMAVLFGAEAGAQPVWQAHHLYDAKVFTLSGETEVFDGLEHLEGESVAIWSDQGELGPKVVTGGEITIDGPGPSVQAIIGKFDASHKARTLDIVASVNDGSSIGRNKRIASCGTRVINSVAGKVRCLTESLGRVQSASSFSSIVPTAVPADLTIGYSGVVEITRPGDWGTETSIEFVPEGGAPLTIAGLVPNIEAAN